LALTTAKLKNIDEKDKLNRKYPTHEKEAHRGKHVMNEEFWGEMS